MATHGKAKGAQRHEAPSCAVMGLEAEFTTFVGGRHELPEKYFGTPQDLVGIKTIRRSGRSLHLPSGGALYFDTGVIEVATPIIEIESCCAVRATRSLWEQIAFLRKTLNRRERDSGHKIQLQGFSAHYNVSFQADPATPWRSPEQLALLLCHILPVPMMLLSANRRSTGIGVRPRGRRIEVTTDFTPDPDLMAAAASLITGIVREVMTWPDYCLSQLERRGIPQMVGVTPRTHTSRKGWLARHDRFPENPFAADPMEDMWLLTDGRRVSLRKMAREIANPFRGSIRAITPANVYEHIFAVIDGRARSLLDFPDRPAEYDDVGRSIKWNRRLHRKLPRSRYEQVIFRVLSGSGLKTADGLFHAERMKGWHQVVFRHNETRRRMVFNLDELAKAAWAKGEAPVFPD